MKRNRGFTLIEITIVLAIVGIMWAMLVPRIQEITSGAKLKESGQSFYTVKLYGAHGIVNEWHAKTTSSIEGGGARIVTMDGQTVEVHGVFTVEKNN